MSEEIVCKCGQPLYRHHDVIPDYPFECSLTYEEVRLNYQLDKITAERDVLINKLIKLRRVLLEIKDEALGGEMDNIYDLSNNALAEIERIK